MGRRRLQRRRLAHHRRPQDRRPLPRPRRRRIPHRRSRKRPFRHRTPHVPPRRLPTYIVLAELAINEVLHGELPQPAFPDALRENAPRQWRTQARLTLDYARTAHAERGHLTHTAGAISVAASQAAHAILAARATWVTNEKRILGDAGLRGIDDILAGLDTEPVTLMAAVDAVAQLLEKTVDEAQDSGARISQIR